MKIALIHNQFNKSGGMESYLLTLINGFLDQGDEVHVHAYEIDRTLAAQYDCAFHATPLFYLPRRLKKYAFLHRYNRSFDRHAYDLSLSLTRTACQDIAVVGGVHPQSVLTRRSQNSYRRAHDAIENYFERKMLTTVPWVVAHSQSIRTDIEHHYAIESDKIRVMHPPINERRFGSSAKTCRNDDLQRFGVSQDKLTLLFPSMSHQRKGLPELLSAYASLDPARHELIVVGEGDSVQGKASENIRFIGYVDDMAALYRAVDYVVLPSHYEPFGLVVVEALESGTPVVVSAAVGAAELIGPGEGIVLADNQPTTLAAAICNLRPAAVEPGFAARHGLETRQHILALKDLAQSRREY